MMASEHPDDRGRDLGSLLKAVQRSKKHADVCPEVILRIGQRELVVRGNVRDAIKSTKRKLHQVGAAYLQGRPRYARWLASLRETGGDPVETRRVCREIMAAHASTRERLPILDRFYAETLADLPPISSLLDLACGYNPLAIPWMPLAPGARYAAIDIYVALAEFLGEALAILGTDGVSEARDVLGPQPFPRAPADEDTPRAGRYDVALLLKAVPCLEQIERAGGLPLLQSIPARHVLVTFPVQSLGGRDVQMRANYSARFAELVAAERWSVARHSFETELAFLVDKGDD